ncbi:SDR family oxidoreductase [Tenacibaculum aiptasiae]|uniref:SDR family oxidoreductase n=1 Tax=Tenacibaculum aiptasiae TaxID=426481 RepID=UPI003B5AF747
MNSTNKTVLITGSSTGIGKSAVKIFQSKGWNVIATMRTPEKETELNKLDNVLVTELDVTKQNTIDLAIEKGLKTFGKIDVLINNAGFGMMGIAEASDEALMQRIFDVNVFGVIRTTKAILPHMRANKNGLILNVSSIVGLFTLPYQGLYHATKHAVEGFTGSIQYELKSLGIDVKLVEPGGVNTEFINNISLTGNKEISDYKEGLEKYMAAVQEYMGHLSTSDSIAEIVYNAVTDNKEQLRYLAGSDAEQFMAARKSMDDKAFFEMVSNQFGLLN